MIKLNNNQLNQIRTDSAEWSLNHPIESNLDKPILNIASFNHGYATIYLKSKLSAENYNSLVFVLLHEQI